MVGTPPSADRTIQIQATEAGPREPASPKRDAILQVARASFLNQGYERTSMEGVAQAAGVSKTTVYAHFPTKADMFRAVIERHCRAQIDLAAGLDWLPADPAQALTVFARRWIDMVSWPDAVAMSRVTLSEIGRFPELGKALIAAAVDPVRQVLSAYLRQAAKDGLLEIGDADFAADLFVDALRGGFFLKRLVGREMTRPEIERLITALVAQTLAVYSPSRRRG